MFEVGSVFIKSYRKNYTKFWISQIQYGDSFKVQSLVMTVNSSQW